MDHNPVLSILLPAIPAITASICIFFVATKRKFCFSPVNKRLHWVLLAYYICAVFIWLMPTPYIYYPTFFIWINTLLYEALLISSVLLYRIAFILTLTDTDERFPYFHYIVATVLPLVLTVWSFFVPFDVQLNLVEGRGTVVEGYMFFSGLFLSKISINFIYFAMYAILSIIRFYRYRHSPHYVRTEESHPLSWLGWLFAVALACALLALVIGAGPADVVLLSDTMFPLIIISISCIYVSLCYNYLAGHYLLPEPRADIPVNKEKYKAVSVVAMETEHADVPYKLERNSFDRYMSGDKPYLDHRLSVASVASDLNTNRAYVSSFINRTYGCNFNRYVNRHRLDEYERLKRENTGIGVHDLVIKAGFANYRHMIRAKQAERDNTTDVKDNQKP